MNFTNNEVDFSQGAGKQVEGAHDSTVLIHLSPKDPFTTKHSYEGIFVAGQSGSGKTTGPGQAFGRAMLRNNYGFLITTTKPDDANMWLNWARLEGREKDVRVFSPEQSWRFGLLDYAYHQGGARGAGDTENVVSLLSDLLEVKNRSRGTAADQVFWIDSMKKGLGHLIDLLAASGEVISFANINKLLQSLPFSLEEVRDPDWQQKSYANRLIDRGIANKNLTRFQQGDLGLAIEHILSVVPRQEERLRSGIMATIDSVIFPFLKSRLGELCDGKSNIFPEDTFREGAPAVIILDLPIKQFAQSGQFIQICFKRLWQQAVERRDTKRFPTSVCQFVDESQHFCTRYDALFQATARSARVCSVAMSQDIHALEAQLGKAETESLLSNFNLKIMCATDHMPTAEWAAKKIGEHYALGANTSVSLGGEGSVSGGMSEQKRWVVPPDEFVKGLRKGGEENGFFVDAIAIRSGRNFLATNNSYVRLKFPQKYES